MPKTSRLLQAQSTQRKAAVPQAAVNEILALFQGGRWDGLEAKARSLTAHHPGLLLGWRALGVARLNLGKTAEAADAMARAATLAPNDAAIHNDLGSVLLDTNRLADAEASYRRALALNPRYAEAHSNLGMLLGRLGRVDEALAHHQAAIDANPSRPESHNNLATLWRDQGRMRDAEVSYRRALELQPGYFDAHVNLGMTLGDLARFDEAQESFRRALAIRPEAYAALIRLGTMLGRLEASDAESTACLTRCIQLQPDGADAYIALGNVHLRRGDRATSEALFAKAQQLRPLIVTPASQARADFSVVLLDTPGAGCTPVDYLTSRAAYDRNFYCVRPGPCEHLDLLAARADVVLNMIADADNGADILPAALELVERLGRPTINHPRIVMDSGREAVAKRLAGTPSCRVPQTRRFDASTLMAAAGNGVLDGLAMPLLVRLAGRHGGDDFAKVADLEALVRFVALHPEADHYVTEYVDYRSADGFFRKYRFICIGAELLPYHLAIHDDWMVHHFRTDMANQAWMRQEEHDFLEHPRRVFDDARHDAMLAMARATRLDYCGLDVGLDAQGQVVLFETNAAMLVHDEKSETFAYKNPYIERIKKAFDAMVARKAAGRVG